MKQRVQVIVWINGRKAGEAFCVVDGPHAERQAERIAQAALVQVEDPDTGTYEEDDT